MERELLNVILTEPRYQPAIASALRVWDKYVSNDIQELDRFD